MTDAQPLQALLAQCALQRESALEELLPPHLYALARRMLRDPAAAEDVLQECFLSIWRQAGQYRPDQSQPMTWMTRIVRNRCIDRLRRPGLELPDPDDALTLAFADDSLARWPAWRPAGKATAWPAAWASWTARSASPSRWRSSTTWRIPTSRRAWTRRWER